MNKDEVTNKIIEIVAEQLGASEDQIKAESILVKDLGYDSLDDVETLMTIEEEYGIEIDDAKAEKVKTVQDIINFVCEIKEGGE